MQLCNSACSCISAASSPLCSFPLLSPLPVRRALQVLGLACALAGFILIFEAVRQATGTSVSTYTTHRRLGIAAMSMGLFQLLALVLRCVCCVMVCAIAACYVCAGIWTWKCGNIWLAV
jgi:small-conductance mechanosensitive channel